MSCGIPAFSSCLNRYHHVVAGGTFPGQTAAPGPHETTTVLCGAAKSLKPFGIPLRRLTFGRPRREAFVGLGPAKSFFFAVKRYQEDGSCCFVSDWTPASSP